MTDPTIDPASSGTTASTGASETVSTTEDPSDTTGGATETDSSESDSETGVIPECDPGFLDCGSGSCDVDSDSDAENCGECGHSCLGGECDGGECQALSLHTNGDIRALVVDETQVFFVTESTLEAIPQEPTPNSEVLVSDTGGSSGAPTALVAQSGLFVFAAGGSNTATGHVIRSPKVGGVTEDVYEAGSETGFVGGPRRLSASANRVYWTFQITSTFAPAQHFLRGVSTSGGSTRTYLSAEATEATAIASTAEHIYWFQGGEIDALRRAPAGFGSATDVMTGLSSCNSIVAGEDGLYFSCRDTSTSLMTLFSSDFDGGNSTILLTEESDLFEDGLRLAVSEDDLVWMDNVGPAIGFESFTRTMTIDGDNLSTVRDGGFNAVDSDAYFWREADQIWMLAK